ncbi:NAD-P-binding protein [Pholiota conissans]|uniref:NAD-P-binding protein n=1 Tax=Pholiota conissans TaxID=109636 RepID=A0A9P6D814_9AGAR|nr:NAD-P-binding protein [Pholiota conissans]
MGNLLSRKFNPVTDLVDLKGKVIIVTGGNAGIGLATVRYLARGGAKVYLAARSEGRATAALKQLESEGLGPGNGQVLWHKLDLSDPRDAKRSAEEFLKKEKGLDVLVNNAGLISAPYAIGLDGVTEMAMVNYISPVVFTRTLLPLLQETAKEPDSDVRIVNVTSIVHKYVPASVKFEEMSDFNVKYANRPLAGLTRYAHSKLMMSLWSRTLQRQLDSDTTAPITVIALHPGGVDTFSHKWIFPRFFHFLVGLAIAAPEVGAYNSVFAAAGKRVRESKAAYHGVYLESHPTGRIAKPSKSVLDDKLAERLRETTDIFLERIGV